MLFSPSITSIPASTEREGQRRRAGRLPGHATSVQPPCLRRRTQTLHGSPRCFTQTLAGSGSAAESITTLQIAVINLTDIDDVIIYHRSCKINVILTPLDLSTYRFKV